MNNPSRRSAATIHSMTGFAAASRELEWGAVSVELRAVNHRYLDLSFRIPDELRQSEQAMREIISAAISRGKVECRVSYALRPGARSRSELDETLLAQLLHLNARVQAVLPAARALGVADVLRWPGMLGDDALPVDEFRAAATDLLRGALEEFSAARAREGAKLAAVILDRAAAMRRRIGEVAPRMPGIIAAFEEKLRARLGEAMLSADDERVRQEITLFINKIDVDEELSRLAAHLDELERIVGGGGASGKRLDFLMQELNREANTLGSKSADVAVTQVAMDLKLLIEQMREQIQNIE